MGNIGKQSTGFYFVGQRDEQNGENPGLSFRTGLSPTGAGWSVQSVTLGLKQYQGLCSVGHECTLMITLLHADSSSGGELERGKTPATG